jgi:hypothetical protein
LPGGALSRQPAGPDRAAADRDFRGAVERCRFRRRVFERADVQRHRAAGLRPHGIGAAGAFGAVGGNFGRATAFRRPFSVSAFEQLAAEALPGVEDLVHEIREFFRPLR